MEQINNAKTFFEVFPTLKVTNELQRLFCDVQILKICTNSTRDFLHIYIFCRHLIQKKEIWGMESAIKEQLFARTSVTVTLQEEYALSEQYTAAALMQAIGELPQ